MIKRAFPILALSIFSSMLGAGIVVPLLPLYAESLGANGFWLGAIFAAFSISRTVVTPLFGRLSDRSGRKPFICIGLLAYAIISLGFIWANSVSQLVLIRLVHGVAGAMILPIAQAYVGDISPEGEEGKWMGYSMAAFFSGFGFGPLIGGALLEGLGIEFAFASMGGLNMLACLLVTFLLPEIGERKTSMGERLSFREMATSGMIRGIFIIRFTQAMGRGAFMVFLPIFAAIYIGLTPTLIGLLISVQVFGMSLLSPFTGRIADKFNRRGLVILSSVMNLIPLALIPLAHSFWHLFVLCLLQGIGGSLSMTSSQALVVEEGRKFGMGSTMAMPMMAMGIGMVVGPLSAGAIHDFANINLVFYFAAGVGLLGTGLFAWFTR